MSINQEGTIRRVLEMANRLHAFNSKLLFSVFSKKPRKMVMGSEPFQQQIGLFVQSTVFLVTPKDAKVMKEEILEPIVNINTFNNDNEIVAKENDTKYGLYDAVYTKDISGALRMAKKLDPRSVGVNCTRPTGAPYMPFGGYTMGGIGCEGWTISLQSYLEVNSVLIKADEE
jgi:aldehyde dehydrogenase (NAD+)